MLNSYDFIQAFVFTTNHHLNEDKVRWRNAKRLQDLLEDTRTTFNMTFLLIGLCSYLLLIWFGKYFYFGLIFSN